MNWKKGMNRAIFVLSILAGPIVFFILCMTGAGPGDAYGDVEGAGFLVAAEILGFAVVWICYFVMYWIIKGFRD